jgi:hypothetical protein
VAADPPMEPAATPADKPAQRYIARAPVVKSSSSEPSITPVTPEPTLNMAVVGVVAGAHG